MRRILAAMSIWLLMVNAFALTGQGDSGTVTLDNVAPAVSIISPNGGEDWYWDDLRQIQWQATDAYMAVNTISVALSINGGSSFNPLFSGIANDGAQNWTVPEISTELAYIKVTAIDTFGNVGNGYSAGAFSIGDVPPQAPQNVTMQIVNSQDVHLSWSPVTQDAHNQPITPDGYIVLYNETASDTNADFYFLGGTIQCTLVHPMVARFRDDMYYRVMAFVDPDGRIWHNLATLNTSSDKISLDRLRLLCSAQNGGEK